MRFPKKAVVVLGLVLAGCASMAVDSVPAPLSALPQVATIDPRFQSYNVEMVEVTGGRFWAPYGGPAGETYRMRPPLDLTSAKLRGLARNLGPSLVRVSGTWANTTYLPARGEAVSEPPEGYKQVLTRAQWRGLVDFAKAVDGDIVTSFPVGPGTRDAAGVWQTEQAQRLVDLTRAAGGKIYAAEFMNEPNAAFAGGLPEGYTTEDYVRDFRIFHDWAQRAAPDMVLVGPGGVGESAVDALPVNGRPKNMLLSRDFLAGNQDMLDVFSYHFYGTVSERCEGRTSLKPTSFNEALLPSWLDRTIGDYEFYAAMRDRFEPGDPIWITETAQAACGGDRWAASFADSFRYVNQLGVLAQRGVQAIFHNTLAASDYSLIDEETLEPRPNYWAALLWNRIMGTRVLDGPQGSSPDLRIYVHCAPAGGGAVGLAALNLGTSAAAVEIGSAGRAWTIAAEALDSETVTINGREPAADAAGRVTIPAAQAVAGQVVVPGRSIAFIEVPKAANPACS